MQLTPAAGQMTVCKGQIPPDFRVEPRPKYLSLFLLSISLSENMDHKYPVPGD